MVVTSGPATLGEKEISKEWPIVEGLTAGTTKLKDDYILRPTEADLTTDEGKGL